MQEMTERLIATLDQWGEFTEAFLNALSLLSIIIGVVVSLVSARKRFGEPHSMHTRFRYKFGGWLIVALEFQLAADIASTIVSPTTEHLVELGVIAVIRTFLNYFLGKELAEEKESLNVKSEKKED
ncbi:DUF1622 domain-containing protein [Polluticoccus soli]|uniref:DUF1622 domain-containing protein n=1 Tax=Polluticoccus soli TaxID=3034150 RepID=UPI0023E0D67C|nr:DUF1622 domain-containing protein [Flavipsychrobacter sp. JY13-12]